MFKYCALPCMKFFNDSDSEECTFNSPLEPVRLNVYDLFKFNEITTNIGLGVYHSGVEIYGKEYGYGGHPYEFSGIFTIQPKNTEQLAEFFRLDSEKVRFKETITIGYTYYNQRDIKRMLRKKLERKFRGNKYHLLSHNCNHFSDFFTKMLCRKSIPGWVNRLAHLSAFVPFMDKCLPVEWVAPFTLEARNHCCRHNRCRQ